MTSARWMLAALLAAALSPAPAGAADPPPPRYRLVLEANPAAPFPFLAKFGTVEISLYPGGISGQAPLLRAFSREGDRSITVLSPFSRLYAELPIARIRPMILTLARADGEVFPGLREFPVEGPVRGKVKGLDALRYRIRLGPESSIDVWTTLALPPNRQYQRLAREFVAAISRPAAAVLARLDGMPVYVELNTTHHRKLPLLRIKSVSPDPEGEEQALQVGRFYAKAPGIDAILK